MLRIATIDDSVIVTKLGLLLWPDYEFNALKKVFEKIILNTNSVIFLQFKDDKAIAFAQCQLRFDYVEGTNSCPVGYLEGIFVAKEYRKMGIAKDLLYYCEKWAKEKGCIEFASDCELTNNKSLQFHLEVGFTEANRIICFTKKL